MYGFMTRIAFSLGIINPESKIPVEFTTMRTFMIEFALKNLRYCSMND